MSSIETPHDPFDGPASDGLGAVSPPQYRPMVAFDICGFGNSGDPHVMRHMRRAMYQVVRSATETAQMSWSECHHEDRGDGLYLLAPVGYSVHSLVDPLAPLVRSGLGAVNKTLPAEHQLRLRMAVHHGEIIRDEHGVVSPDLNMLFRLLNAPVLRARFEAGDLALIVSEDVYQRVVKWGMGLIDSKEFQPLLVDNKEAFCVAWAALPPQPAAVLDDSVRLGGSTAIALLEQFMEKMRDQFRNDSQN